MHNEGEAQDRWPSDILQRVTVFGVQNRLLITGIIGADKNGNQIHLAKFFDDRSNRSRDCF
jgi:hypothetical protein